MTNGTNTKAEAQAILDHAEAHVRPVALPVGDGELVAVPRGLSVVDLRPMLDERLERPRRREGTATLTTLASFIAHANRFKDAHSAIFAIDDRNEPKLLAVLDYHEAGTGPPRFGGHRAEYAFPLSDEWQAWMRAGVEEMMQARFAAFLEDRITDVQEVSAIVPGSKLATLAEKLGIALAGPSQLLALSRGLAIRVDQKVTNAVNLSTGEGSIGFEETHRAGDASGPLKVPGGFAIAIPVFRGGAVYQIGVRLRYRVHGGTVMWRVALHRVDLAFADAFGEACEKAKSETSLPLFYGTPEETDGE